ncbi:hypothetical protein MED121_22652 [Marinomonas sp. MED121]|nr:hypothetical protein MED121_22652 [Marinomonas sp. MED121]
MENGVHEVYRLQVSSLDGLLLKKHSYIRLYESSVLFSQK